MESSQFSEENTQKVNLQTNTISSSSTVSFGITPSRVKRNGNKNGKNLPSSWEKLLFLSHI